MANADLSSVVTLRNELEVSLKIVDVKVMKGAWKKAPHNNVAGSKTDQFTLTGGA